MKTLYAITCVNKDGDRVLWYPNRGQHHYAEKADAEQLLAAAKANNRPSDLGKDMQVRPVECYDNGDAVGIYINDEVQS